MFGDGIGLLWLGGHLGAHQPVRRQLHRVEKWITRPDLVDVVHAEAGVLEEVGSLRIDVELVIIAEEAHVAPLGHTSNCIPTDYIPPYAR